MKTPSPRARLVCRVVRSWCSAESAHVSSCADCQRFFAATRVLETSLRRDAAKLSIEADTDHGFEQRILHAVRRSAAPVRTRHRGGLGITGAALAAVAIGLVIFQGRRASEMNAVSASLARADAALLVDAVQTLSHRLVDSVIPSAGALVADNPMQRELDSIYADARSALGFLALNFMPAAGQRAEPRSG